MVALSALVSGLDAELVRLGYKDSTMVWYRGCWRRLERFFAARGVEEFSLDVAMAWVDEACGFFAKEQAGTLKQTDVYLFRVAQMLGDYAAHGAVLRRYSRTVSKLTGDGADCRRPVPGVAAGRRPERVDRAGLRDAGRGVRRVRGHARRDGPLRRRDGRGVRRHAGRIPGQDRRAEAVRVAVVPQVRLRRRAWSTPPCWRRSRRCGPASRPGSRRCGIPADVARILDAIDRGNPCGKRDYAIILLITRLGLRGIDVKRLEFSDFDWPGNRLSVVQAKTGHRVQLPLLKDVGWAVIDYVRAWPAGQRLPAGVPAAHRPDRPVLRPGPSAPDPGQARPGGSCPGQREAPPRHALA